MKEINYEVLESMGLLDYYFDLSKFIHNFINKNYPLNEEDIRCLSANLVPEWASVSLLCYVPV